MSRNLAACLVLLLSGAALAAAPQPPVVDARAWLLLDATSGQLIASRNPKERIEPASLTKLMTAYLAFAALKGRSLALGQTIRVSERAWRTAGSRMFIEPRKPVTVEELLHGMIVQSGNDACITNFTNSSGLPDPRHYSTASDLALLTSALIRDYPEYYKLYSEREYRYNDITQRNRNQLLWLDPNVDGVKTGHTESAGYSLIASARRGGRRLVSVVIGTTSESLRSRESQKLLNFGFQAYDTLRLYQKGDAIGKLQVWKGSEPELKAGVAADLYVTVPKGTADQLRAELVSQQPLIAPLEAGARVATLRVAHDGKPLAEYPVIALQGVAVAGFFARTWDSVRLWFR